MKIYIQRCHLPLPKNKMVKGKDFKIFSSFSQPNMQWQLRSVTKGYHGTKKSKVQTIYNGSKSS